MTFSRAPLAVLAATVLLSLLPASADAATSCSAPALFSPLSAYGDHRLYFNPPGGDFETHSWTLAGGATLASGSGPLRAGAARSALRLPPGASATSPTFCVDLDYPTLRFFSTQRAARSNSKLNVDVIYPALAKSTPKASVSGSPAWTLSKDVKLRPERVDKAGGWRYVQVRFTAEPAATGDWRVDDVLVDPRMRG